MTSRRRFHPRVYGNIVAKQGGVCACGCGERLGADPRDIQFDHVIPLVDGGADEPENMQALLRHHHQRKTTREAIDRARVRRIAANGGRRKLNQQERYLAKLLGESGNAE